jgi:hypothetical protein
VAPVSTMAVVFAWEFVGGAKVEYFAKVCLDVKTSAPHRHNQWQRSVLPP